MFGYEYSSGFIMPKGVNIDDELDWMLAEALLLERDRLL